MAAHSIKTIDVCLLDNFPCDLYIVNVYDKNNYGSYRKEREWPRMHMVPSPPKGLMYQTLVCFEYVTSIVSKDKLVNNYILGEVLKKPMSTAA